MPRKVCVTCDAKECREELPGESLAESVASGWIRRTVVDTLGPAQAGDSEYSGQQVLYYCPKHAELLDAPGLAESIVVEMARRDVVKETPGESPG